MKYAAVQKYLRNFNDCLGTQEPPYDSGGAIILFKAILENLQENFKDYDFEEYANSLNEENEKFLKRLVIEIPKSRRIFLAEWEDKIKVLEIQNAKKADEFINDLNKQELLKIRQELTFGKLKAVRYIKDEYNLNLALAKAITDMVARRKDSKK